MCIDEFRWGEFFKLNREKQTLNHKSQNNDRNHDNNKDNYNRMSYAKNIVVINALDSRRGWEGLECVKASVSSFRHATEVVMVVVVAANNADAAAAAENKIRMKRIMDCALSTLC